MPLSTSTRLSITRLVCAATPSGNGAASSSGEVGIWPVWMCPIGPQADAARWTLYPMERRLYVNFGFWDVVRSREARGPGHVNRAIEREVAAAGGVKSLYSESYYPRDEFDARYGGPAYAALKAKYDPAGAFPTLYEKCVLRH